MSRCRFLLFPAMIFSLTMNAQNFDSLTTQIFFNLNLKNQDTTLLSELRSKPGLVMDQHNGWTSYPPNINPDSIPWIQRFYFSSHPYFLSKFTMGNLEIYISRQDPKVIGGSLSLSFESVPTRDSVYTNLKSMYRQYASKVIKRSNMTHREEVSKYLSPNRKDFVIITKGASDNHPYLNIAYNYDGYEW